MKVDRARLAAAERRCAAAPPIAPTEAAASAHAAPQESTHPQTKGRQSGQGKGKAAKKGSDAAAAATGARPRAVPNSETLHLLNTLLQGAAFWSVLEAQGGKGGGKEGSSTQGSERDTPQWHAASTAIGRLRKAAAKSRPSASQKEAALGAAQQAMAKLRQVHAEEGSRDGPEEGSVKGKGKAKDVHAEAGLRAGERRGGVASTKARQSILALKSIGRKSMTPIDPSIKRMICKGCQTVLIPGMTSSVRVKSSGPHTHRVLTTCLKCDERRRLPAPPIQPQPQREKQRWGTAPTKPAAPSTHKRRRAPGAPFEERGDGFMPRKRRARTRPPRDTMLEEEEAIYDALRPAAPTLQPRVRSVSQRLRRRRARYDKWERMYGSGPPSAGSSSAEEHALDAAEKAASKAVHIDGGASAAPPPPDTETSPADPPLPAPAPVDAPIVQASPRTPAPLPRLAFWERTSGWTARLHASLPSPTPAQEGPDTPPPRLLPTPQHLLAAASLRGEHLLSVGLGRGGVVGDLLPGGSGGDAVREDAGRGGRGGSRGRGRGA